MISYNLRNQRYESSLLYDFRVTSGFTVRQTGDARHAEAILSYLRINQLIFHKLIILEQVHSANIAEFTSQNKELLEKLPETDGVFTKDEGVVLAVRTADCIPVLYADTKKKIVGITHNGWRGTYKQIGSKMIARMVENGSNADDIRVVLGPGIGACCYDIDEGRHLEFLEEYGEDFASFPVRGGKRHLNLLKLNIELMLHAGLKKEQIDFFPFCTSCDQNRFFSFRRDYKKHPDKFGEMLSFIMMHISNE